MAKSGVVARHLRTLLKVGAVGSLSDGQLLERFVARHGEVAEAAFAALVERHGPMVLGVCRRALADLRDAEDAFQATFLILVKKAGTVRVDDSLGRWLYGVACRVAARARAGAIRRQAREGEGLVDRAGPSLDSDRLDLRKVLDEELGRLPEKYRAPVVLCYLEGLTHELAAERLGWPVGTVRGRLSRARERLRTRLSSRGLAPTAAGLWDFPMPTPTGAVSQALIEETARAAIQYATARIAVGGISIAVAVLTEGTLKTMVLSKLKTSAVLLFAMAATSMVAPAFLAASGPPKPGHRGQPAAALEQIKSEPQPTPKQIEASELAARAFGPTHWSTAKALPVRYSNHERGYWIYAKEYERLNGGKQLRLRPFAIVLKSHDGRPLKTATSDEAIVDLDQPLGGVNQSGASLKIIHTRIEGNVRINDGQGTPDPADDIAIGPLASAEFDESSLSIRSESDVTIEGPDMRITGSGLSIQLYPNDEGSGVKSIEIGKRVDIRINNLSRWKVGAGQPEAANGQEGPESLALRCAGMMRIEWPRPERDVKSGLRAASEPTAVFLSGAVVVLRRGDKGQESDRLECDELRFNLRSVLSRGAVAGPSVHELRATGDDVWSWSPAQGIMAHCTEVTFKRRPPDQGDETYLRSEGETKVRVLKVEETVAEGLGKRPRRWVTSIMATDVTIIEDAQDRENRTIVARGPGRLATRPVEDRPFRAIAVPDLDLLKPSPARNKPVERKASWQDQLIMRTVFDSHDRPTKKVTLTGRPTFFGPESETLSADKSIVITLKPTLD